MNSLHNYLKQNPKKHLIFDFDGTIFKLNWEHEEDVNDYRRRFWEMIKNFDPDLVAGTPDPIPGRTEILVNKAIRKHGDKAKEHIFPFLEDKENSLIKTAKPIREIVDFVNSKNKDHTFHIWSSNLASTVKVILLQKKIFQYFDKIVGRENVNQSKPDPEGFELIFDPKFQKSDYLMIGDADRDSGAAQNAGIDFFLVE